MDLLKKIQQQPKYVRKLILWTITIIISIGLIVLWVWFSYQKIREFPKRQFMKNLNIPSLKSEIKQNLQIKKTGEDIIDNKNNERQQGTK